MSSKKIVIFASGSGSSVENILIKFKETSKINVVKIYCNNHKAFVLERAKKYNIKTLVFSVSDLNNNVLFDDLNLIKPDLIVLAGFLKKIPELIIESFKNKIINIHPSLLPKYGGKGMYGLNVHKKVIVNNDSETGFTIHHVNKEYDEGDIIFQKKIEVDTSLADELAKKVLKEEHKHYPLIIEKILNEA